MPQFQSTLHRFFEIRRAPPAIVQSGYSPGEERRYFQTELPELFAFQTRQMRIQPVLEACVRLALIAIEQRPGATEDEIVRMTAQAFFETYEDNIYRFPDAGEDMESTENEEANSDQGDMDDGYSQATTTTGGVVSDGYTSNASDADL